MKKYRERLKLPEGVFETEVMKFDESDRNLLNKIYTEWRTLNKLLISINSRSVNLPEGLSESAFCLEMDAVRVPGAISGANNSFDCYDLASKKRIQVKACSVLPDLTSFGPRSEWDQLYFVDFYRNGKWDGTFDIYMIPTDYIRNYHVNAAQTFRDQQIQGRRPRFSIFKEIIVKKGLRPVRTGNLKS